MPEKTVTLDRKVPAFAAAASGGRKWKLADAAGRNLVVYFYPKDNTSGCTREGEAFRDLHAKFRKAGTEIVGVSPDSVASHDKFIARYGFTFPLLADEDKGRVPALRRVEGKEHVRQEVHGCRTQHVPDRRQGRAAPGMAQSQSARPR